MSPIAAAILAIVQTLAPLLLRFFEEMQSGGGSLADAAARVLASESVDQILGAHSKLQEAEAAAKARVGEPA